MDKWAKLRAMILKKYGGSYWHWHGKLDGSLTVVNVKTGKCKTFARIE